MGFSSHATKVIRLNRALLKKRSVRTKAEVYGNPIETELSFKSSSPHALQRVRNQLETNRRSNVMASIIALFLMGCIGFLIYLWLS